MAKVLHNGTPGTCIGGFYYWDTVEDIPNDDDILSGMPEGVSGVATFLTYPKQENIRAFLNRELAAVVTTKLGENYYHNVKYGSLADRIRKVKSVVIYKCIENGKEYLKLKGRTTLEVGDPVSYHGAQTPGSHYWGVYLKQYAGAIKTIKGFKLDIDYGTIDTSHLCAYLTDAKLEEVRNGLAEASR